MADIAAYRWYPTLVPDGSQDGVLILGGTNLRPTTPSGYVMDSVNSYEVARTQFNAQPVPLLQPSPQDFHRKPVATRWEPPYFHLNYGSVPPSGITVRHKATGVTVPQDAIGLPSCMTYGQIYEGLWTNALEPGIEVNSVVLMRPAALTHHDDGGQRLVRLNAWHEVDGSISFKSPGSDLIAPRGWWMLFLVTTSGRPSLAYWVNLG